MKIFLTALLSIFFLSVLGQNKTLIPSSTNGRSLTISISPDKSILASYDQSSQIMIWEVESGKFLKEIAHPSANTAVVRFLNSNDLMVASQDSAIYILDIQTGKVKSRYETAGSVYQLDISKNGSYFMAWGMNSLSLFEIISGKTIFTYNTDYLMGASFSNRSEYFSFASYDSLFIYNIKGEQLAIAEANFSMLHPVFSPDDKLIFTNHYAEGRIYSVPDAELQSTLEGHDGVINYGVFHPSSKLLVTCSDDSTVKLWDPQMGELIGTLAGHKGEVNHADFNESGTKLLTTALDKTSVHQREINVWHIPSLKKERTISFGKLPVNTASFNRDGNKLIIDFLHSVPPRILDANSGEIFASLKTEVSNIKSAAFGKDDSEIYSISDDGKSRIWNIREKTVEECELKTFFNKVYTGIFATNNAIVVRAFKGVEVWDTLTKKKFMTIDSLNNPTWGQFSPDGSMIITASVLHDNGREMGDAPPKIWKAENGSLLKELKGHRLGVNSARFNTDGSMVVTASEDSTVKVWKSKDGNLIADLPHPGRVNLAEFSENHQFLVSGLSDGTIFIWDLRKNKILKTFSTGKEAVNIVYLSSNGKIVLTVHQYGHMRVWDAETGKCLQQMYIQDGKGIFIDDQN